MTWGNQPNNPYGQPPSAPGRPGWTRKRSLFPAAAVLLATALLTSCSSGDDNAKPATGRSSAATTGFDCDDPALSPADRTANCEGPSPSTDLPFGKSYTWPDGLKVSIVEAKVFTDFTADEGAADPDAYEFRIKLKVTNTSKTALSLDDLSTFVEGATSGGEAAATDFAKGAEPITGRLAPGAAATKTDDNVLEKKYGRKIVITVQRSSGDYGEPNPEFTGSITG